MSIHQQSLHRQTQLSVTCFLHCGDQYLFVHRTKKGNSCDFGRLNGVGGKLQAGENYLECAVREVEEETGYQVQPKNCRLAAVVTLTGGYPEDWAMVFFQIKVGSMTVPNGMENDEGQLLWLPKDQVLTAPYELVDDLQYLWPDITASNKVVFFSAEVNQNQKIASYSKSII